MEKDIENLSRELGVDDVRFLDPSPLIAVKRQHESAAGFKKYTERLVYDPAELLPGATCILLLFKRYAPAGPARAGTIHVSEYYRTSHALYLAAQDIAGYIRLRGKRALSTYLIPIKPLALRAGGAIGKNGFYYHPAFGSLVAMRTVLTDAAAPKTYPAGDSFCGDCRKCISACPSGAVGEYGADLNKCLREGINGTLDVTLRKDVYQLFGCEKCQTACPVNQAAAVAYEPTALPLAELLDGRHIDMLKRMVGKNTARKKRVLSQCVLYAANTDDTDMLPRILQYIGDPTSFLAEHARWAAAQLRGEDKG